MFQSAYDEIPHSAASITVFKQDKDIRAGCCMIIHNMTVKHHLLQSGPAVQDDLGFDVKSDNLVSLPSVNIFEDNMNKANGCPVALAQH